MSEVDVKQVNAVKKNEAAFPLIQNEEFDEAQLSLTKQSTLDATLQTHKQFIDRKKRNSDNEEIDDSPQMKRVKGWLERVDKLLTAKVDPDPIMYKKQIQALRDTYSGLIRECDFYLGFKLSGLWGVAKQRKNMVRNIKLMAESEMSAFNDLEMNRQFLDFHTEDALIGWNLSNHVRDYRLATTKEYTKFNLEDALTDKLMAKQGDDYVGISQSIPVKMEFLSKPRTKDRRIVEEVGSSRLAQFIGVEDVLQRTRQAVIKDKDGNFHFGRLTDKTDPASQKTFEELSDGAHRIVYSMDAIRELSRIRLFSILLGRTDIDEKKDILFTYEQEEKEDGQNVYRIKGAMLKSTVTGQAHPFSTDVNPDDINAQLLSLKNELGIDEDMSLSISMLSEEHLSFIASDLLNEQQIKAFNTRLGLVKTALRKLPPVKHVNRNHRTNGGWNSPQYRSRLNKQLKQNGQEMITFPGLFAKDAFELESDVKAGDIPEPPLLEDNNIRLSVNRNDAPKSFVREEANIREKEAVEKKEADREEADILKKKEGEEKQDEPVQDDEDELMEEDEENIVRHEDHVFMESGKINYIDDRFFAGEGHYMKKLKRILNKGAGLQYDKIDGGFIYDKPEQLYTYDDILGLPDTATGTLDRIQKKMEKVVSTCRKYRFTHLWPRTERGKKRKAEVMEIEERARDRIEACKIRRAEIIEKYDDEKHEDTTSPFGQATHGGKHAKVWAKTIFLGTLLGNIWTMLGMGVTAAFWPFVSAIKSIKKGELSSAYHVPFPRGVKFWYRRFLTSEAAAIREKGGKEVKTGIKYIYNKNLGAESPWHNYFGMVGILRKKLKHSVKIDEPRSTVNEDNIDNSNDAD